MIELTLPYPPSANRYWRNFRGRMVQSKAAREYIEQVRLAHSGHDLMEGQVVVTVSLYRPRKSGDLDNFFKVALDALQGVVYKDDKQVIEIHAYRHDDKQNPRAVVTVQEK